MRLLLIRHAEPDYANDTITPTGHQQAQALAQRLSRAPLSHLWASPMGRAQATARYIAQVQGLEPIVLEWLRELNGNWEGDRWAWNMRGAEVLNTEPPIEWTNWPERVPYGALLLPQWRDLARRADELLAGFGYVREGWRYAVRQSNDLRLAFVCHAGTILTLLSYWLNWPLPLVYVHLSCEPSSVTELLWEEHEGYAVPRAVHINDMSHWER